MADAKPPAPSTVPVVAPDGTLGTVGTSDVAAALAAGGKVATPEDIARDTRERDYGGLGGGIKATALGGLRGVTMGLSDAAIAGIGGKDASRALAGYRDENPIASGAGELAGAVAPILASGGESLAAKALGTLGAAPRLAAGAGRLAEEGVALGLGEGSTALGRIGRQVLGQGAAGAAEASLYGAGQAISESALGDEDLTAEHVLAHMGESATFGGLLGGGTAIPFALAGEAGRAFAGVAKRGASRLGELAEATGPRIMNGLDSANSGLGNAWDKAPGYLQKLDEHAADILPSSDELQKLSDEQAWRATYARKKYTQEADARAGGSAAVGRVLKDTGVIKSEDGVIANALSPSDLVTRIEAAKDRVGAELGDITRNSSTTVRAGTLDRLIDEEIAPLRDIAGRENVVKSLEEYKQSLRTKLNAVDPLTGKFLADTKVPIQDIARQRIGLQKIVYDEAKALDPGARVQYLRNIRNSMGDLETNALVAEGADAGKIATLKRQYQGLRIAEDATNDSISRLGANRSIGATDYLAFIGGGGGASGAALALVNKVARERGSAAASALLDDLAKTRSIVTSAKKLGIEASAGLRDVAEKYQVQQRSMAALGAMQKASAGISKKIDVGVKEFMNVANHTTEVAKGEAKSFAAGAGAVVRKAREVRSTGYANAFAQATNDRRSTRPPRREVEAMAQSYIALARNPALLQARVEKALGAVPTYAPNIAQAMTVKLTNAAAFLAEKAPPGRTNANSLTPQLEKPRYSDDDIVRFQKYLLAIETPTSIITDMLQGRLSRESVEAVRAVYPKLYEQIRNEVIEGTASLDKPLPIERAVQIGILFDAPTHWSLEPAALKTLQATYEQNGAEASVAPEPSGNQSVPARPLSGQIVSRSMTSAERIEGAS